MAQDSSEAKSVRVSHGLVDGIVAAVIFLIGIVMIADNYRIGAGWASDGPQAGYFPLRIGVILSVCSAVIIAQLLLKKQRSTAEFVTWDRLKPVLLVLGPTVAYVLGTQFVGIYISSAVFIAGFMRLMGKYSWFKSLAVSIGVAVALFWMFEIQFMVPLPKSPLESSLFSGY